MNILNDDAITIKDFTYSEEPIKPTIGSLVGGASTSSMDLHGDISGIDALYEMFQAYDVPETHLDSQGRRVNSKTLLPVDSDAPESVDIRGTLR